MRTLALLLTVGLTACICRLPELRLREDLDSPAPSEASLRGICAAPDGSVWASGSGGTVLRRLDGAGGWHRLGIAGAEQLDFRDIEAFDAARAVVLAAGPGGSSRIYRTDDGGVTWTETFRNPDPEGFFDGFAFWTGSRGVLYGDPVDGRFSVWTTRDGGRRWRRVPANRMPPAEPGEHAFAASGTGITTHGSQQAWFVTGGSVARVFRTEDGGRSWEVSSLPLAQGRPSAGAFGIAFVSRFRGVAVGGDYEQPESTDGTLAYTVDGGRSWRPAQENLRGYRSGVVSGGHGIVLAVGPNGLDCVDLNSARRWSLPRGGHSLSVVDDGRGAWVSGATGLLYSFTYWN